MHSPKIRASGLSLVRCARQIRRQDGRAVSSAKALIRGYRYPTVLLNSVRSATSTGRALPTRAGWWVMRANTGVLLPDYGSQWALSGARGTCRVLFSNRAFDSDSGLGRHYPIPIPNSKNTSHGVGVLGTRPDIDLGRSLAMNQE